MQSHLVFPVGIYNYFDENVFGWKVSQNIFRIKNFFDKDAPYPNCFGNLLTPQVVLTTLKCFIKVKAVREYYGLPQKYKTVENDSGIFLHLIFIILQFETSSLMNWLFSLFQTWILQATAGRKIQFKLGKKSSSPNSIFQTGELRKSSSTF